MEASEALLRHLESSQVPRSSMLLLGQSIGCAVAIQMASRGFGRGLFLLSPFWSVHEMASVLFKFPPLRSIVSRAPFLIFDKLDSGLHVASLKIMHGSNDDVVPRDLSRQAPRRGL
jgi:predicted esterase